MRGPVTFFMLLSGLAPAASALQTELRVGGVAASTRRNVLPEAGAVTRTSSSMTGGDFVARHGGIGLAVRYLKGNFSPAVAASGYRNLGQLRAELLMGRRPFAVAVGYERRATAAKLFGAEGEDLLTAGAVSHIGLGPSGLSIVLTGGAGGRILRDSVTQSISDIEVAGWHLSTGVLFQAPRRLPLFAFAGYQFERFRSRQAGTSRAREELGRVVVAAGIRWLP